MHGKAVEEPLMAAGIRKGRVSAENYGLTLFCGCPQPAPREECVLQKGSFPVALNDVSFKGVEGRAGFLHAAATTICTG